MIRTLKSSYFVVFYFYLKECFGSMYHVTCISIYPNLTSPVSTQTPKERPERKHIKKKTTHAHTHTETPSFSSLKKKKKKNSTKFLFLPRNQTNLSSSPSLRFLLYFNQYLVASSFSNQPLKFIDFRCFYTKFFSGYRLNLLNLLYLLLSWSGYSYSFVGLR